MIQTLPSILRLYYPEEAYFFAALSLDRNSKGAREILNNVLKRTVTCKSDSLFLDEWMLVREFVASIEGGDVKNTKYLIDIPSVKARLGEIILEAHSFRPLNELHSISRFSLRKFLMAEHTHNYFENTEMYLDEKVVRDYALKEMATYIPIVRQMIDLK